MSLTQRYTRLIGKRRAWEGLSPYSFPSDTSKVRAAKSKATRAVQQVLNLTNSARKLKAMLDVNFEPDDLFVTLTFRDSCLPKTRRDTIKCARHFFDMLRKARKLKGNVLKYIYTVEHGEGRWHIHAVVNAVGLDYEQILSLWNRWGDNVDFKYLKEKGIDGIAHYIVKETDRPNSARAWIVSKNLQRSTYESYIVKKPVKLQTPDGCKEIAEKSERRDEIGYAFIAYDVPSSLCIADVSGLGDLTDPDIRLISRRPL